MNVSLERLPQLTLADYREMNAAWDGIFSLPPGQGGLSKEEDEEFYDVEFLLEDVMRMLLWGRSGAANSDRMWLEEDLCHLQKALTTSTKMTELEVKILLQRVRNYYLSIILLQGRPYQSDDMFDGLVKDIQKLINHPEIADELPEDDGGEGEDDGEADENEGEDEVEENEDGEDGDDGEDE